MILVTGCAGFIGYNLCERLLADGHDVVGVDNLNDYYDAQLKEARLHRLQANPRFLFARADLADAGAIARLFTEHRPEVVANLAAQAGVRYSLVNPHAYTNSNVTGFLNILEGCRQHPVRHLIYASSSSVYGANTKVPFAVEDRVDQPISLYAATKRANELMAQTYSHLFGIPTTGLRFFTVYGPWGRPDMAPSLFAKSIFAGEPIEVFNEGQMQRDFTYVDDVVESVVRLLPRTPPGKPPHRIYNVGNHQPVALLDFIATIERASGRKAQLRYKPLQAGDVKVTCADIEPLAAEIGFRPSTPLADGVERFIAWYREYHKL
jgi:UDP-glucuronate 4-epimerase